MGSRLAPRGHPNKRRQVGVYLSDPAWNGLMSQAMSFNYVSRTTAVRKRGISSYIEALSKCSFEDNRPDYLRIDSARLNVLRLPLWYEPEFDRIQRSVTITQQACDNFIKIALTHKMTNVKFMLRSLTQPYGLIGVALEAIGLTYLIPINMEPK